MQALVVLPRGARLAEGPLSTFRRVSFGFLTLTQTLYRELSVSVNGPKSVHCSATTTGILTLLRPGSAALKLA